MRREEQEDERGTRRMIKRRKRDGRKGEGKDGVIKTRAGA